jgi:ActR/RegA family two-component response regulator
MSDQLMSGERQPPLAVLLVDEESARRESLTRSFRELGFAVRPAAGLKEAIAGIRAGPPGLAVVQIGPVTAANLHLIIELRGRWLDVRIIVIDSQGFLLTQRAVTSGVSLLCTNEEDLLHVLSLRRVYLAPSVPHPASHPLDLTLARAEWTYPSGIGWMWGQRHRDSEVTRYPSPIVAAQVAQASAQWGMKHA